MRHKKKIKFDMPDIFTSKTSYTNDWQETSSSGYGIIRIGVNKIRWIFQRAINE